MNRWSRQVVVGVPLTILVLVFVIFYSSDLHGVHRRTVSACCKTSKLWSVAEILGKCSPQVQQKHSTLPCDCEALLACKLVVVTAFSDNHFEEATDFIASVQTHMPGTPILVYDLGLNKDNKNTLSNYCQVNVRGFDFSKYPKHVERLFTCAWKPLMINELYQEMEDGVVLYCDASCRLQSSLKPLFLRFSWFPIISGLSDTHMFISTIHDGMMKYLHLNKTRKEYASIGNSLQAGAEMFWLNPELEDRFLKYWTDCALHSECISPQGAIVYPCDFTRMNEGVYAGCHRYDQAAYNAILTREFGMDFMKQMAKNSTNEYYTIERYPTTSFIVRTKLEKCEDIG